MSLVNIIEVSDPDTLSTKQSEHKDKGTGYYREAEHPSNIHNHQFAVWPFAM